MTYNFDDEDNSWLDASLEAVPVKITKTEARATSKGFWKMSPEFCAKVSAGLKGRTLSAETCAKVSAGLKGRTLSAETCAKISAARKGRPLSAKQKASLQGVNAKPIMTPSGVFPSQWAAGEWAQANGLLNAHQKIRKWRKTHPKLFYLIKKETI
jgi:hypothetical protein